MLILKNEKRRKLFLFDLFLFVVYLFLRLEIALGSDFKAPLQMISIIT